MNYSQLFYWLVVADNARMFFQVLVWIFTAVTVISTVSYFLNHEESEKESQAMSRKWVWWSAPIATLFWGLLIFTPSKKDALIIVAGGQTMNFLTTDSSAKKIPAELSHFLVTEIKNVAQEAKVDLNIQSQKDKILDEVKGLSGAELIEKMKTDSTVRKIIMEQ